MKPLYDMNTGVAGVRYATEADEDQIYDMLVLLHAENGLFSLNPDKVRAGIQWATQRHGGLIFVIEERGRIVASLGMVMTADWYSDDEYWLERWNFVHPAHRKGTDHARKLLEQSKWVSDWFTRKGYTMPVMVGIISNIRTEGKVRLYARHMVCQGGFFMYGQAPRQGKLVREEMQRVEEMNRKARREGSTEVRPAAEAVIRASRENGHVR